MAAQAKPAIEARNLRIGYTAKGEQREIFPAFSAVAGEAELVALLGRNGRGKSTLLRTIIGIQPPLDGAVHILEKDIRAYPLRTLATLVSYVSTDNVKVGNLKVFDLVSLGRYPYTGWFGALSADDKKVVMQSLAMVGMEAYAWQNTGCLSDGERQRVVIARALAQDTPIIVLDEPTAFLDLPNRYEIVLLLKQLAQEQRRAILFSTHDLSIALKIADRVWVMCDGEFHQGAPQKLMHENVFDKLLQNTRLSVDHETGEVRVKADYFDHPPLP
ncbi:MAG: ABC transporter ATP-binding protein [Prevotellaceae bacterium]|jgi:iron complex transport system ATP-binding protein|nr:ABC transporter ATP-binding protein [Prevotellaceae bacterium]